MGLFTRIVEFGRVVLINYGPETGKLAVIVDVLDANRALVEGPDFPRQVVNFKRVTITNIKIDIPRAIGTGALKKVLAKNDIQAKFNSSSWGKKLINRKVRAGLSDFDRFKLMIAKNQRRYIVGKAYKKVKA